MKFANDLICKFLLYTIKRIKIFMLRMILPYPKIMQKRFLIKRMRKVRE